MLIYISTSNDPYYNFAVEHWLFKNNIEHLPIIYLWQNSPCIIIGRSQNPWLECDITSIKKEELPIIRRYSGGGAVYHDLGNINFTYIDKTKESKNFTLINTLKMLNIISSFSKRHDIIVELQGKKYKVSGSAFRKTRDVLLKHNTLLINSNLNKLQTYLHHQIDNRITSKGVKSVRSEVLNLSRISKNLTVHKFKKIFLQQFDKDNIIYLKDNLDIPILNLEKKKIKEWQWNFGKTPAFIKKIEYMEQSIEIHINNGSIVEIKADNKFKNLKQYILKENPKYKKKAILSKKNFNKDEKLLISIIKNDL